MFIKNICDNDGNIIISLNPCDDEKLRDSMYKLLLKTKSLKNTINIINSISEMDKKYLQSEIIYINEAIKNEDI